MHSERLPFISQGGAYMAVGTPTGGPNDAVQDNVLFIIMASQAKVISLDSLACSRSPSSIMSWRCLVETEPDVASGIAHHVAKRAVYLAA